MMNIEKMSVLERQNTEYYMGYKRGSKHRIFVNRSLQLGKMKFFGFDMDYTLAMYKSPELETLSFDLLKNRMVEIGYPKEFESFKYDPTFPIRGLWVDKMYGNLLKMDNYGNILMAFHGFRRLTTAEVVELYPNKFVKFDQSRMYITNTLYNLPETYLIAATVDYFESQRKKTFTNNNSNVPEIIEGTSEDSKDTIQSEITLSDNLTITFSSIINDIRDCMDYTHMGPDLASLVSEIDVYVERCPELPEMLLRIKNSGAKTFLLTNSDFQYSLKICNYILYCKENNTTWHTYFDYIVTSAQKPKFFFEGSLLRVMNPVTNKPELGHHTGPLETGLVYSGGSVETFSKLIGAHGKDVLYFGDHIFGDILKSKKVVGWRTCLIVPELENEIFVWQNKGKLFEDLQNLHAELAELYKNLDLGSTNLPDVSTLREKSQNLARVMEDSYGTFGSLFRCGARQTFFAGQVLMYADLYTTSCLNLMRYPLCYMFQAPFMLMPHESTVAHIYNSSENDTALYHHENRDLDNETRPSYAGDDQLEQEWQGASGEASSPIPPIGLRRRSTEVHNTNIATQTSMSPLSTSSSKLLYKNVCPASDKFVNKSPNEITEEKQ